jgi:hypothetical protein
MIEEVLLQGSKVSADIRFIYEVRSSVNGGGYIDEY